MTDTIQGKWEPLFIDDIWKCEHVFKQVEKDCKTLDPNEFKLSPETYGLVLKALRDIEGERRAGISFARDGT